MTLSNVNQTLTTRVRIRMNNAKVSKNNLLCNWFIRTGVHGDYEYIIIQDSSGGICLFISVLNTKLSAPTADGVKQYFNENPLWVFYELATPIYTHLESGLYDEITIPTSDIKNEIYSENGKWYHKRNIGKAIFDGSSDETWYYDAIFKRFNSSDIKDCIYKKERVPVYIKGYAYSNTSGDNFDALAFLSGANKEDKLYIYNYAYTSVKDFRAYLAENPLEVYYELAEPIISELYFTDLTYKLNEPLRSLPNGVCDTIEEGKIVRRVGYVLFKDISNYTLTNAISIYNRVGIILDDAVKDSNRYPIISDKFYSSHNNQYNSTGSAFSASSKIYVCLGLNTVDEYIDWFKNNPTKFLYPLATPIETEITPDMILINGEPITDTVGIELPDGTKDSIENDYYVKRVGKVIIDGKNGTYQRSGTSTSTLDVYVVRNLGIQIILKKMNTNYIYQCDSEIDMSKYITVGKWANDSTSGSVVFKVPTEEYLWSDIHNAFLENPITLYVELATPIKIPLFSIKEGLTILKSTNNITPQIELDCLVRDDFQNMCDNVWEIGDIVYETGVIDDTNSSRIRLINYIKVKSNTTYKIDITNLVLGNVIALRCYDISKTYINSGSGAIGKISKAPLYFTTPEDCYYIRFIVETTDTNFKLYLNKTPHLIVN